MYLYGCIPGRNVHIRVCVYTDLVFPLDTSASTVSIVGSKYLNAFHPRLLSSIHDCMWGVHQDTRAP